MTPATEPTATASPRRSTRARREVRSVRRWAAGLIAASIAVLVAAAVATVAATMQSNATTAADETVRRIGQRSADLVVAHLAVAGASIDQIAVNATDDVLADRDDVLDRLLASQLIAHPQLAGAYVGFADGAFRFASRDDDGIVLRRIDTEPAYLATDTRVAGDELLPLATEVVETDYDPRRRPWFEDAETTDGEVWTAPYVFFRSGQPGVTLARALRTDDDAVAAVIGVDVRLDELDRFLDDLPIDEGAEAFLLAGETVVAAPASLELAAHETSAGDGDGLPTIDDVGLDAAALDTLLDDDSPLDIGGDRRVHRIQLDDPGAPDWAVLIRTERIGLVESIDDVGRLAIALIVLAGTALLVATPLLTRWLRRPIEELSQRARVDALTEVANRGTFLEEAREALGRAHRLDTEFVLAVLDVDEFKQINDRHGHAVGDQVLQSLGLALLEATRPDDLVGRLGGDEFAIAISDLDEPRTARMLERLQHAVDASFDGLLDVHVTVTIGASARNGRKILLDDLLLEADHRLLLAKRTEKGTVAWRTGPNDDSTAPPLQPH